MAEGFGKEGGEAVECFWLLEDEEEGGLQPGEKQRWALSCSHGRQAATQNHLSPVSFYIIASERHA